MRVLLTGGAGQVGQALRQYVPAGVELISTSRRGDSESGLLPLDLADAFACRTAILKYKPDWVLNSGAFTAVDDAERRPDLAFAVNGHAPKAFAEALLETGGRLLQLSTNFVFNGKQGTPYKPADFRDPLNVYGASKALGEEAVEQMLMQRGLGVILRTSWVVSPVKNNFVLTILDLHRQFCLRGEPLRVVEDQIGGLTSAASLAEVCWKIITNNVQTSVLHWCNTGAASRYDIAVSVGEIACELGLLQKSALVNPIPTASFPTLAERPLYSLLDCSSSRTTFDLIPLHWRQELRRILEVL